MTYRPVSPTEVLSKVLISKCMQKYAKDKVKLRHNLARLGLTRGPDGRSYFDPYKYYEQEVAQGLAERLTAQQFIAQERRAYDTE